MGYRPRRACLRCGGDRDAVGGLSRSGKCSRCGPLAYEEAARSIATRRGPAYDRYLDGLTSYVARLWGETVPQDPGPLVVSAGSGVNTNTATMVRTRAPEPA